MSAVTSIKPAKHFVKAIVNETIRSRPHVRRIAEDVPEHVSELAIGALAETGFADFAIAEGSDEALAKSGNSVASQLAERAADVDSLISQVLECNSQLVSDLPLRSLGEPLNRLAKRCLERAPSVPNVRVVAGKDRVESLEEFAAQALAIGERLDHACKELNERGFIGTIRHNASRSVAEIKSGHTVTTDHKLSEREERREGPAKKTTGWFITREKTETTVAKIYEIETTEIHVRQRHLLLQAEHCDIRSNVERPEHIQKLSIELPDWLAHELLLSTGHLHNYEVQKEELQRYRHEVEESTIEINVRRRLNDRGRDRDLFFGTMMLGAAIGGPLAAILANSFTAGAAVASAGVFGALALDPAISWGPHCLCSWLPKGMVPQQISARGNSR